MSIAKLKKVTLFGLYTEKEKLLNNLQELGLMHLASLKPQATEMQLKTPPIHTLKALKFLLDCPQKRHPQTDENDFDIEYYVHYALAVKQNLSEASDQRDALIARIKEVEPWGDFTFPQAEQLAGRKFWFYIVPVGKMAALTTELVWQVVHRDHRYAYLVVISKQEPAADQFPVPRTHMGKHSLSDLKKQLNAIELKLEDLRAEQASLTRWIYLISKNLAAVENKAGLMEAANNALDLDSLTLVQGWVAETDLPRIRQFTEQNRIAMLAAEPSESDAPPTLLDNPAKLQAGEKLIGFYQTPGYWEWDPAILVFFSFSVFFAMIISDAGYAFLLALIILFSWKKISRSPSADKFKNLLISMTAAAMVWGMLIGSYFGFKPADFSLLGQFNVIDLHHFDNMMRLTISLGVIHLSAAIYFKAFAGRRNATQKIEAFGWLSMLWGGLLLWYQQSLAADHSDLMTIAEIMISLGVGLVFLFSSRRSIKTPLDVLLKILDGLRNLAGITRLFGDVLSYLRLFALGLAGASLAYTFNDLALRTREIEGLGLLYSILIMLLGHLLNLLLSLMGAVLHGMRLNCIEFFNWGLSEEGYPFKPFSKKDIKQ